MPAETKKKLNPKRELFCEMYATNRATFGNGVQAYAEAYEKDLSNPKEYATCRQQAYVLLTNPDVLKRIDELMELGPMNETTVDRQLAFLMEQNAEFPSKLGAIREFNKLQDRIKERIDLTSGDKPIPLLANVPTNDSTAEDTTTEQAHQGDSGGDERRQDGGDPDVPDQQSPDPA